MGKEINKFWYQDKIRKQYEKMPSETLKEELKWYAKYNQLLTNRHAKVISHILKKRKIKEQS